MNWCIKEVLTATGGRYLYGGAGQCFQSVGIDSRNIDPEALFVAIRGVHHDAHDFISQVVDHGVKGIVIEEQTQRPMHHGRWKAEGVACVTVPDTTRALGALAAFARERLDIPVLAITGSSGKTTTRQMAAAVMARRYETLVTEGNLNNEIGLPLTLLKLDRTHQAAVLELGINHFGEMDRLGAICKPTMGMITNVGPAHLEFLGSLDGVARAKGELLPHIDPKGYVILNKDDDYVSALAARASCQAVCFGISPRADISAESIVESADGIAFTLILPDARVPVQLKTSGRFMVSNALAAAAAGHLSGVGARQIQQGLESFTPESGRLQVIETAMGVKIIDDTYNANPASMAAAFQTLSALRKSGRCFVVLGDMLELGDQAGQLHRQVGVAAGKIGVVKLYAHGDHASELISGARQSGMPTGQLLAAGKEEIISDLEQQLGPEDWVLVKGSRGMKMETVVRAITDWGNAAENK
ncbi:MAG: UDP-N-acetylmuramoyl-tripeptide--D-alanyl-D-alanine ligase [Desulfobacteraceae bacterium]|jgi:UDP-N-acetylmuramoyl-tripeptide--D-alanyl-D-alanine ligase